MARLLCPVRSMATRSGTFARIRLRAAVRRQSWRKRVGTPAAWQAVRHAVRQRRIVIPSRWKTSGLSGSRRARRRAMASAMGCEMGSTPPPGFRAGGREPDDAAGLVDLVPSEAEDLVLAPAGVVGEVENVLPRGGEVGADGEVFGVLEEALAGGILAEPVGEAGHGVEPAPVDGERAHAVEGRGFAIDGAGGRPGSAPGELVLADLVRGERGGPRGAAEERSEMGGAAAGGAVGPELPDQVVLEVGVAEISQGRPLEAERARQRRAGDVGAEGHEKCRPNRLTPAGSSCNNAARQRRAGDVGAGWPSRFVWVHGRGSSFPAATGGGRRSTFALAGRIGKWNVRRRTDGDVTGTIVRDGGRAGAGHDARGA